MSTKFKIPTDLEELKEAFKVESRKYQHGLKVGPKRNRIRITNIINKMVELMGEDSYNAWLWEYHSREENT